MYRAVRSCIPRWLSCQYSGFVVTPCRPDDAVRVGSLRIAVANPSPLFALAPFLFQFPHTVSVGSKQPPSAAFVSGAHVRRGKGSVSPGISTRHEGGDDFAPAFGTDARGVFEPDERRPDGVDDAEDFPNEAAALTCDTGATASR